MACWDYECGLAEFIGRLFREARGCTLFAIVGDFTLGLQVSKQENSVMESFLCRLTWTCLIDEGGIVGVGEITLRKLVKDLLFESD